MHASKALFLASLALPFTVVVIDSLRNPRGVADGSPWNLMGIALVVLGFALCVASPFLSDRPIRAKAVLSIAAGAGYFALLVLLTIAQLVAFGLPAQD